MINFMCQLAWVMRCSGIWSNIILSVPKRVLVHQINNEIGALSKEDHLP